jgi:putative pyrroloquinoline-quinone binding quinoprotein
MRRLTGRRALALATPLLILALLGVAWFTIAPSAVASATPTISVTGYPGPGETLMVDGGNWPYGDTITITYDGAQLATTVARFRPAIAEPAGGASIDASFKVGVQIPLETTMGAHTIAATDTTHTSVTAQTAITVVPEWPQFGFTAANTRYNPYETAIGPDTIANLMLGWSRALTFPVGGPVVADGSVFVSTGQAGASYVALDPATGVTRWSLLTPWGGVGAPAIYDGMLYGEYNDLRDPANVFAAYNAANGNVLWTVQSGSGFGEPVLANGMVYVVGVYPSTLGITDGIGAFNPYGCGKATCAPMWSHTDLWGHVSPIPAVTSDSIYFGSANGGGCQGCGVTMDHLVVVDSHTGALQWLGDIGDWQQSGTPVVDNGYVIVTANTEVGYPGTPPDPGGTLYVFNAAGCGQTVCQPLWTVSSLTGWGPSAAVANGVIYVGDDDGSLEAFNEAGCGKATCSPLWMSPATTSPISGQTAPSVSSPAVANGVVYFTNTVPNEVMAFKAAGCGEATCSPIWSYPFGARTTVAGSPVIINGTLYVSGYISSASSYGLYAFRLPTSPHHGSSAVSPAPPAAPQRGANQPPHTFSRAREIWVVRLSRYRDGLALDRPLI